MHKQADFARTTLTICVGSSGAAAIAVVNPPKSAVASGLLQGMLEGQGEDGDDDDDDEEKSGTDVKPVDGKSIYFVHIAASDLRRRQEEEKAQQEKE